MENPGGLTRPSDDPRSPASRRSFTNPGTWMGSLLGLFAVWRMMSGVIDPKVTEHKAIFPLAVVMLCAFAVFVWLLFTMIGQVVGSWVGADADVGPGEEFEPTSQT